MRRIAFRYGVQMFAGFSLLFLIAHLLGLSEHYHLRILNGIIHLCFIYLAVRQYQQRHPDGVEHYIPGVAMGMYTSFVGVTLFCLAMGLFLTYNQAFFYDLKMSMPMPEYFTPVTAALAIFSEGTVVSLVGSYIVVRILDAQQEKGHA